MPLAGCQPGKELGGPPRLVVLVVAQEAGLDPVALEQPLRVARVLAQDDVGFSELA